MRLKNSALIFLVMAMVLISCQGKIGNNKLEQDNLTSSDTSQQIMNEETFWKLIDKSRSIANNNYQEQIISLKDVLLTLDAADIEKFDNTFTALMAGSYTYKLWGAAYVINGGCSDDCFDYFRQYLVGHGREKFYQTIKDPESCVDWMKSEEDDNWGGLEFCAMEAYKKKTGKDLPKTYQPKFELKGKPFDEATVMKEYPRLAKKFLGSN